MVFISEQQPSSRKARLTQDAERRRTAARYVREWSVSDFRRLLEDAGIHRAFVLFENGEYRLSHKQLQPLQAFFELSHDFSSHEGIFIGYEPGIDTIFTAFVHDTRRGLSQGGLRLWPYANLADVVSDGLRLSQGMTRKNALAGLRWGGGKGIIPLPPHAKTAENYKREEFREERERLFAAYGRFVASLDGVYYTAEDMGTGTADMNVLLANNRYTTCIASDRGGSGNPSAHTAWGVYRAIQAGWRHLHGTDDLRNVHVAVQGAGNVGLPLIEHLHRAGARITVGEFAPECRQRVREMFRDVEVLEDYDAIFDVEAEIFAPCARGDVLNAETIPRLRVQLVCGAANNQLGEPADAGRLDARNIVYIPDYVCNRMGIVNCANEWAGYLEEDIVLASERVYPDTARVLRHAQTLRISTADAADQLSDIAAAELHPLLGHRGRRIVDRLVRSGWSSAEKAQKTNEKAQEPARTRTPHRFTPAADEPRMYREAERRGEFAGSGPAIAAMPLSTAARPHLGLFLSPLLMDVEARTRDAGARRAIGLDHGGATLQHAVRASLSYDVEEITRDDFILECHDHHARNDAAIRHQLAQAGIGFEARRWLDPMNAEGAEVVARLFYRLQDSRRVVRDEYAGYRCPECATVLADSEMVEDDGAMRCERCGTPLEREMSQQIFLDMTREAPDLMRAIENDVVTFGDAKSRKDVLQQLRELKPICVSRQSWWGNQLPAAPGQVLSPWFTLAAWSLQAAGWPRNATPEPIDTVYTDSAFLARWIVPSQLMALAVYGRPIFRHVEVHGAVHVVERANEDVHPEERFDEERYIHRTVLRRMSPRFGNVVEPGSLVQRFGADALRLWYLLCYRTNDRGGVVLTEAHAREARHAVARLNAALSSLLPPGACDVELARPVDDAVLIRVCELANEGRAALLRRRHAEAANLFVDAVNCIATYARIVEPRVRTTAVRATATAVVHALGALAPICPFIIRRFAEEVAQFAPAGATLTHAWVAHLSTLRGRIGTRPTELAAATEFIRAEAAEHLPDVARVLDMRVRLVDWIASDSGDVSFVSVADPRTQSRPQEVKQD